MLGEVMPQNRQADQMRDGRQPPEVYDDTPVEHGELVPERKCRDQDRIAVEELNVAKPEQDEAQGLAFARGIGGWLKAKDALE